jgi:C4-dicarboxylate-specific signal transduction histidine kinase
VRHPDVPSEIFKNLWKIIKSKKTYIATVKNKRKNGSTFYVNTTVIPMLNENNDIEEYIAIRYDITKSIELTQKLKNKEQELENLNITLEQRVKRQTEALLDLNQNLEKKIQEEVLKNREKDRVLFQQSRLASMGEMIGNIAHQWRQPLNELGIILYKIKKLFNTKNDIEFKKTYEKSKKVIQQMSQTIEDFRDFFNPNRPKEIFSIKDILEETISMFEGTQERENIFFELTCKDKILMKGYPSELSQIFINLVNNSKDAYNNIGVKKKKIIIDIKKIDYNYVMISIKDNAGGIKDDIIEKIFEPYFTTKHSSIGTGLGLYMSKMIVENSMRGTIAVKNDENGICFDIKIPIQGELFE